MTTESTQKKTKLRVGLTERSVDMLLSKASTRNLTPYFQVHTEVKRPQCAFPLEKSLIMTESNLNESVTNTNLFEKKLQ